LFKALREIPLEFPMIRPTIPDDSAAIIALAVAAGMFPANETEALGKVLADYFGGNLDG